MRTDSLSREFEQDTKILTQFAQAALQTVRAQRSIRKGDLLLSSLMGTMTASDLRSGPEYDLFKEVARTRGKAYNPNKIILPITWLTQQVTLDEARRDLTAANAGAGGYLISTSLGEAVHELRPWSILLSGGVQLEENLQGPVSVPRAVSGSSITWQSSETAQASPSNVVLGQTAMSPKIGIGVINASRNFWKQTNAESWIRRELLRAAGVAIDAGALAGTGASGQPLGLVNTPGLSTQSGTSLAWDGVLAMKKNAAVADIPDGSINFLSNPTTRALLEAREKATGNGGFIWQDDKIANCPAYATTLMPADTMLCGPLSGVTIGLWSDLEIEINPYDSTMFRYGSVQVRVYVAIDVAITVPLTAFTLASSIT